MGLTFTHCSWLFVCFEQPLKVSSSWSVGVCDYVCWKLPAPILKSQQISRATLELENRAEQCYASHYAFLGFCALSYSNFALFLCLFRRKEWRQQEDRWCEGRVEIRFKPIIYTLDNFILLIYLLCYIILYHRQQFTPLLTVFVCVCERVVESFT